MNNLNPIYLNECVLMELDAREWAIYLGKLLKNGEITREQYNELIEKALNNDSKYLSAASLTDATNELRMDLRKMQQRAIINKDKAAAEAMAKAGERTKKSVKKHVGDISEKSTSFARKLDGLHRKGNYGGVDAVEKLAREEAEFGHLLSTPLETHEPPTEALKRLTFKDSKGRVQPRTPRIFSFAKDGAHYSVPSDRVVPVDVMTDYKTGVEKSKGILQKAREKAHKLVAKPLEHAGYRAEVAAQRAKDLASLDKRSWSKKLLQKLAKHFKK